MKLNIIEAEKLANDINSMLPKANGIVAYALSKNLRILTTELTEYGKIKSDLFQKYGETLENGNMRIKDENISTFMEQMKQFEHEDINVELRTLKESEVIESGLNGQDMFLIDKIIE